MGRESKASQTNTFTGGMNLDLDNSLIQSSQYRYAKNVRSITGENGTSGSLTNVEGPLLVNDTWMKHGEIILTSGSIRDIGFAITRVPTDSGYTNYIYRIDFGSKTQPIFTNVLNSAGLDFNIPSSKHISTVARYEDHDNIKLYWADGVNYIRSINIASTHDSANQAITIPAYFNITPDSVLSAPTIESIGTGRLNSGMIQYAYQLVNSAGSETDISLLSKQVAITPSDIDTISTKYKGGRIDEIAGAPAGRSVKLSIDINESDFKRIKLYSIYYANFGDEPIINIITNRKISGNKVTIVDSGSTYIGELTLEEFNALSPIRRIPGVMESHENILFIGGTKEDTFDLSGYDTRAFSFNQDNIAVLYDENRGEIELNRGDLSDPDFESILPMDHDCIVAEKYSKEHYHDLDYIYNDGDTKVLGGIGPNVSYMFTNTYLIESMGQYLRKVVDTSRDDNKITDWIDRRMPRIGSEIKNLSSISIMKSDSSVSSIPLASLGISNHIGHLDYSNPILSAALKSYKRDEIYRFAAVFHSKDGRRSPAKWIADIRFPAGYTLEGSDYNDRYECNIADNPAQSDKYSSVGLSSLRREELVVKPMGLSFEFINIPEGVAKIEIVRSKRDINNRTIYLQGLVKKIGTYRGEQEYNETTVVKLVNAGLVNSFRPHPIIGMGDEYAIGGISYSEGERLFSGYKDTYGFTNDYPTWFSDLTHDKFAIIPRVTQAAVDRDPLLENTQAKPYNMRSGMHLSPLFASMSSFFLVNTESAVYGDDYVLSIKKAMVNPTISVQDIIWPMSTPSMAFSGTPPAPIQCIKYPGFGKSIHSAMKIKTASPIDDYEPTAMYFGADVNPINYRADKLISNEDNKHAFLYGLVSLSPISLFSNTNGSNNKYVATGSSVIQFLNGDIDVTTNTNASMDLVYIGLGGLLLSKQDEDGTNCYAYRNGVYRTGSDRSQILISSSDPDNLDHPNAFVDQTQVEAMNSVTFKYYDRMYDRTDYKYEQGYEYYGQEFPQITAIKRNSSAYTDYINISNPGSGQVGERHRELGWFCQTVNSLGLKLFDINGSGHVSPGKPIENAIEYSQIDGKPYLNWAKPLVSGDTANFDEASMSTVMAKLRASGPHGDGVLFSIEKGKTLPSFTEIFNPTRPGEFDSVDMDVRRWSRLRSAGRTALASYLVDIKSMNQGIYGGNTYNARQMSEYIPTGFHLSPNNSTADGVVFGGDTYINILDYTMVRASDPYVTAVTEEQLTGKGRGSIILSQVKQVGAMIPMESSINTRMQSGESYCQSDYNPAIQKDPGAYMTAGNNGAKWASSQKQPEFDYNAAYSSEQTAIGYVSLLDIDEVNKDFDSRVYNSEVKTNDELIDSWSKFKPANYLDVDSRYGKITRLKSFKNKLLFWQENAVGALSVNDRALITDNEGASLALGTSGILSRHDYISTSTGISKEMISGLIAGPSTIYWYDHDRAEFNTIADGATSISKSKGIQRLLNKSKDSISNKIPVAYDYKYNEVIVGITGIGLAMDGSYLLHNEDGFIMINEDTPISI